jgi:hypothetical protein
MQPMPRWILHRLDRQSQLQRLPHRILLLFRGFLCLPSLFAWILQQSDQPDRMLLVRCGHLSALNRSIGLRALSGRQQQRRSQSDLLRSLLAWLLLFSQRFSAMQRV